MSIYVRTAQEWVPGSANPKSKGESLGEDKGDSMGVTERASLRPFFHGTSGPRRVALAAVVMLLVPLAGLATRAAADQPPATFEGNLSFDSAAGCGFAVSSSVAVVVDDAQGARLFDDSVPTDPGGCFGTGFGFDLVSGMRISVSDGFVAKELTLVELTIDGIDPGADTVSGTAPPNTTFNVDADTAGDGSGWQGLDATSDGSGHWIARFAGIGVDITPCTHVGANIGDEDGDQTATDAQAQPCGGPPPNQPDFTDPNAFRGAIAGLGAPTVIDFEDIDAQPGNGLEGRPAFDPNTYADRGITFSNPNDVSLYVAPGGLTPCEGGGEPCSVWNESNSLSVGEFPFPEQVVDDNDDDLVVRLDPPRAAVGFTLVDNGSHRPDEFIQFIDADGGLIRQTGLPFDFQPFRSFAGIVSRGRPIAAINIVEGAADGDDVDFDDFILVPPPTPDFTPSEITVVNEPVGTDYGMTPAYTGWARTIDVDVSNVGGAAGEAGLDVWVTTSTDGTRTLVGSAMLQLRAGQSARETFSWNGFGTLGDVTVEAITCSPEDQNPGNDRAKTSHHVVAGGTRFGLSGPVTFGGAGNSCPAPAP